ncbi:MAG: 16S rRNA (cytosine(1402)-N(4))-methyltransferase RsmH [Firmicutes bacterium]|nr:16S rRNA (cytosine(1402)-N(4))-methyltransferase RsmH [Bacillota bacterium]
MQHYSVLKNESIDGLNIKKDGIYVDATLGYAGHSSEILKKITTGKLYCFDNDEIAIKASNERLSKISNNYKIFHSNFVNMKEILQNEGVEKVDGILFDLGFSSPQIDDSARGFSFMRDGKLDMRMDQSKEFDAYQIVNNYDVEKLKEIFFKYGEEKTSSAIAKKIVDARNDKNIETTLELVDIIKSAVGLKYFNQNHPERNIFQAIRIEVNGELNVLESVLPDAIDLLNKNGRISVITFHSLEDRIVKKIFKENSEVNEIFKGLPEIPDEYKPKIKLINRKPILPTDEEIKENSRSKSAKLRIIERV